MKTNPTVAILLCTYNGEKYIEAQLDSIKNQEYPYIRCYIHDDGSSDKTVSILRDYENSYPELFINLEYENTSHGAVANFMSLLNYASENCKEDYYMFSDQDDIWLPTKVSDSVKELQKYDRDSTPALVYCDQKVVDEELNILVDSTNKLVGKNLEDDQFKRIVFRNTAAGCCMCLNKALLLVASKSQDIQNIPMHDWWVMLIASYFNNAHYLDKTLMLYRQHGDNTLGVDNNDYFRKIKKYLGNFRNSISARKQQTEKCKREMLELSRIGVHSINQEELNNFISACKCNKIYRTIFCLSNGYIKMNNLFLLFFI